MGSEERRLKFFITAVFLILGLGFIVKFGGARLLRAYVEAGTGNCRQIPIFCCQPAEKIVFPAADENYIAGLLPYKFSDLKISLPKGLTVVNGEIKSVYYKKKKYPAGESRAYLMRRPAGFFTGLFPDLVKKGIVKDDYEFIKKVMFARMDRISGLTDAFFIIMKGIFTPDLGDQKNIKIIEFEQDSRRGFIAYNFTPQANYFDCDIIDRQGNFLKAYISDRSAKLSLDNMLGIISTFE